MLQRWAFIPVAVPQVPVRGREPRRHVAEKCLEYHVSLLRAKVHLTTRRLGAKAFRLVGGEAISVATKDEASPLVESYPIVDHLARLRVLAIPVCALS